MKPPYTNRQICKYIGDEATVGCSMKDICHITILSKTKNHIYLETDHDLGYMWLDLTKHDFADGSDCERGGYKGCMHKMTMQFFYDWLLEHGAKKKKRTRVKRYSTNSIYD